MTNTTVNIRRLQSRRVIARLKDYPGKKDMIQNGRKMYGLIDKRQEELVKNNIQN